MLTLRTCRRATRRQLLTKNNEMIVLLTADEDVMCLTLHCLRLASH